MLANGIGIKSPGIRGLRANIIIIKCKYKGQLQARRVRLADIEFGLLECVMEVWTVVGRRVHGADAAGRLQVHVAQNQRDPHLVQ